MQRTVFRLHIRHNLDHLLGPWLFPNVSQGDLHDRENYYLIVEMTAPNWATTKHTSFSRDAIWSDNLRFSLRA